MAAEGYLAKEGASEAAGDNNKEAGDNSKEAGDNSEVGDRKSRPLPGRKAEACRRIGIKADI